jgi:hypothetical protein
MGIKPDAKYVQTGHAKQDAALSRELLRRSHQSRHRNEVPPGRNVEHAFFEKNRFIPAIRDIAIYDGMYVMQEGTRGEVDVSTRVQTTENLQCVWATLVDHVHKRSQGFASCERRQLHPALLARGERFTLALQDP